MTTTAYSGVVRVHYGFMYLTKDGDFVNDFGIVGQANGLCGAGVAEQLFLVTGLHTGEVPVDVTWHEGEPALADEWEDVVEVSFDVPASSMVLISFDDAIELELGAGGPHRVRYCASGLDAAHQMDTPEEGEDAPDRYAIQLWPAESRPDEIVRQTSGHAAYWHSETTSSR